MKEHAGSQGKFAKPNNAPIRAVAVISSHVMAGAVGNRAAGFALERLGHPVWEVPTVILPWHPGHGPSTRQTIDAELFAKSLQDLTSHPDFASLGALVSGYMGSVEQVEAVARFVDDLKRKNPGAIYLCDPVCGEEKGLYIAEDIANAIREKLIPRADIITPNRFEFDWLMGSQSRNNEELAEQARILGCTRCLITSAFPLMRNAMANLLVHTDQQSGKETILMCEHPAIANPPNGTGDMFAALFVAHMLAGKSNELALKQASSAILEVVARSAKEGYRDLEVARFGDRFYHPMAMVQIRNVGLKPKITKAKKAVKANSDSS